YQAKPTEKHLKEVKRIFRYLWGTVNMGLYYTKDSGFELTRFSDVDYAGCKDTFKSTSGGAQFLGEKLVSWSPKKQDCTALSTTEAEYVSLSACCAQVLWIGTQLTDYGFYFDKIPIYCDSKSAIAISCNPVQHSRTKHIAIRYYFIKEHVEKGTIELYFVKTDYQLADIFTKALPTDRFNYLVRRLGMRSLSPKELERLAKSQTFRVMLFSIHSDEWKSFQSQHQTALRGEIRKLTDVNINKLHQPWTSFTAIINKCLSRKSTGYDSLRLSQFSVMLPIELTNEDIRNSEAYKEYYAVASGAAPPKTKASVRKTKSSSDTTITPPTTAGTRLLTSTKGKQPAKLSKAKCLTVLLEVAMTEAEQLKLATKRSEAQIYQSSKV
nr:retrovirus-related Pol polyprotein from transposon TNT 1-94 [Tanacetum cinerariifolium]